MPRDERNGTNIPTMYREYNGLRHKSTTQSGRQSLGKGSHFLQKICITEQIRALEGVH